MKNHSIGIVFVETDVFVLIFVAVCILARAKKFRGDEKMPNSKLHLVSLCFEEINHLVFVDV